MTTTNETRHTPGPWDISWGTYQDGEGHEVCEYRKQGQPLACIAKVCFHDDQDGETKANARLLAAAPDMLEALKMIRDGCGPDTWEGQKACAAIAKAEGR